MDKVNYFDLNNISSRTGEPVNQAPALSEAPATATSETPEATSTAPAPATTENPTPAPDSTTPAASEAVPATINATSTGEPVNQAPTPGTTETPEAPATSEASTPEIATSETPASTASETTSAAPTSATLPAGYLTDGSMIDADGVMLPEYIGEYAQELAQRLKPLKASTFQRAFLTKAKEANKKKVPYSVKKNCAQGMVIAALKLVSRKQDPAPRVLLDMIRAATVTVVDNSTFDVLYVHLDAIYTNLLVG